MSYEDSFIFLNLLIFWYTRVNFNNIGEIPLGFGTKYVLLESVAELVRFTFYTTSANMVKNPNY